MNMRKLFAVFLVIILGIGFVIAQESPADPLWQKAVTLAGANLDWVPGKTMSRVIELDDSGKTKSITESWFRFYLDQDNQVEAELLKEVKDGKDITAERRKKMAENRKKQTAAPDSKNEKRPKKNIDLSDSNPFVPEIQSTVTKKNLERREVVQGENCLVYEYKFTGDELSYKGLVWLEETTGTPLKLKYSLVPLPKYTTRMLTIIHYYSGNNGEWYPATMTMEAAGKFLLVKKNLRMVFEFSEYWKHSGAVTK